MPVKVSELYYKPLPDNPHWISGGVLPKSSIILVGGEAKIGKTWLSLEIAQTLTLGGNLWGLDGFKSKDPVGVHYFDAEVGEYEFHRRVKLKYEALNKPPADNFYFDSKLPGFTVDSTKGQTILAKALEESKAKVVIIDPIGAAMSGDENSNNDVEKVFTNLSELMIDSPELSFVLVHHYGKPPKIKDDYDPLTPYNFRGASKFVDRAASLLTVMRMADHPGEWMRLKTRFTVRQGPPPEHDIKLSVLPGGMVIPTPEAAKVPSVGGPKKPLRWVKPT